MFAPSRSIGVMYAGDVWIAKKIPLVLFVKNALKKATILATEFNSKETLVAAATAVTLKPGMKTTFVQITKDNTT